MDSYKIVPSRVADGHQKETQVPEALLGQSGEIYSDLCCLDTFQNHGIKVVFLTGSCSVGSAFVVNLPFLDFLNLIDRTRSSRNCAS